MNKVSDTLKVIKVIIVDDHASVRQNYTLLISAQPGLQLCGTATSGAEALSKIAITMPDLIVLDLSLEGDMDGAELLKILRTTHADLRVLVVSGYDEPHFIERIIRLGACGYVTKGDAAAFLQAIRQFTSPVPH